MAEPGTVTATACSGQPLLNRLFTRGWEFDFFQAVWLLERYAGEHVAVGERGPVGREAFRFRPDVQMGFPSADIRRISECHDHVTDDEYYQVDVTFLGLYGASTPLPLHYAVDILRTVEQAAARPEEQAETEAAPAGRSGEESGRAPARDFLDIFHHRLISLFYRSWLKYRYDRAYGLPHRDVVTDYLLWLIGSSPQAEEAALGVSPVRMLRYAGPLTQHPRSAATLEGVLSDYWTGYPLELHQCMGRWVPVPPDDLNCAGVVNCRLGVDLTVGEQVYDLSGAFDITLGPVDWETYTLFLPDGPRFAQTRALVQLYCADPLASRLEIRLCAGEVPEMQLSSNGEGSRLGYTSWVRTDDLPETSVTFCMLSAASPEQPGEPAETESPREVATPLTQ